MPSTKDPASLENLHDIVEPLLVSLWWPLAPGWWIVIGAVALISGWLGWRWWRRWCVNAYRREALKELDVMKDPAKLTSLLKRVALATYPREMVAGLSGSRWVDFLNGSAAVAHFDGGIAEQMVYLEYIPKQAVKSPDADLINAAKRWINSHKPFNPQAFPKSSSYSERSGKFEDDNGIEYG